MKLVFLSDTHGLHDHVRVPPCDVLIHCGDFTNDIGQKSLRDFLIWLERQPSKSKVFVAGNHDGALEKWPDLSRLMIKEIAPSCIYLEDSGCEIDGIKFWGSPYTPTFYNWFFNRNRGDEIAAHWSRIPDKLDVLITHGPPKGILDYNPGDKFHCGCEDLLARVSAVRPEIHAFGHIHSGYGIQHSGFSPTVFVNASICDYRYMPVNAPITFEL